MTWLHLECVLLLRQRAWVLACVSFALLCLLAAATGAHQVRQHRATERALYQEEQLAQQRALALARDADAGRAKPGQFQDPRDVSNYVRTVLNAPVVLPQTAASIVSGTPANNGAWYFNVNLGPQSKSLTAVEYASPEGRRMGTLDLQALITLLLPLFLIVVGYSVWTADREEHMERLVAMGVHSRDRVYALRLLLATLPCVLILLLSCAAAMGYSYRFSDETAFARSCGEVLLLVLAYASFWLLLIFLVIRSRLLPFAALTRLVLCWLGLCVVLPAVAQWHARSMVPLPSRSALLDAMREHNDVLGKQAAKLQQAYLANHPELHVKVNQPLTPGATALITAEANDKFLQQQECALQGLRERQQRMLQRWSFVAPSLLAQELLQRVEGDDLEHRTAFVWGTTEYIGRLRSFYRPWLFQSQPLSAASVTRFDGYPAPDGQAAVKPHP